ncbi:putative RNA methyltransferase [Delphinella strobiligena]|nr:putative RNA methyltransferase [Delphinella strobiligena]
MSGYKSNKRKRDVAAPQIRDDEVDTTKPSAVFTPTGGRQHTLSIALPGSVIANCQTHEAKTALAAQIARALAVFSVDEVIIFNDGQSHPPRARGKPAYDPRDDETGYTGYSDPDDFLYHVLSYLETPPHLRKTLFPMHPNLRTAGACSSLDMPHHLRANEWCQYREGVSQGKAADHSTKKKSSGPSTLVDCGFPVRVPTDIPAGSRVTVRFASRDEPEHDGYTPLPAEAVSPDTPREEAGYYWGYSTRLASSLSAIFTEHRLLAHPILPSNLLFPNLNLLNHHPPLPKNWNHFLIVFGGVAGLEVALKADEELTSKGVTEASDVFDYWVNLVPQQGSRTIRTEEAVWLGLMGLRGVVQRRRGEV